MSLRCRALVSDDGVTVVETVIALMVLSVGLLALTGSLVASAAAQHDQRVRTSATRAGNAFLEEQRMLGFDALKATIDQACPGATACSLPPLTVQRPGAPAYIVAATLSEVDARTGSGVPVAGRPTVMQVAANVTWGIKGRPKSMHFATAVAPVKPDLTRDIKSIAFFPDPTIVSPTSDTDIFPHGQPTQDLRINVELKGLPANTPVSVRWNDSQGAKGPYPLTSTDAKTWTVLLSRSSIRQPIPAEEHYGSIEFRINADIGGGVILTQQQTLRLARVNIPPTFQAPPPVRVSPTTIALHRSGGLKGRNSVPVTFAAKVDGLHAEDGSPLGTVTAYWQSSGNWISAALSWDAATWTWKRDIPVAGQMFPTNVSNLTVYFQAVRTSDGANSYIATPVVLS